MSREEELKKEVEKLEAKLEAFKKELDKPKTHYPQIIEGFTVFGCDGSLTGHLGNCQARHKVGNLFETKEKAERSNLYKLLNSEYDYWFPGFSEKPDFEPNGLQYFNHAYDEWLDSSYKVDDWDSSIYRWKRSEN